MVLGGTFYKIYAIGKWPRLSLALYLLMGWSVVLIFKPVMDRLEPISMALLVAEGIFYTSGTYFFAYDSKPHFHAIWHVFVLLGAMAHFLAVLTIVV